MLNYIIEVSICWSGFYLLYYLLLRRETFFRINRFYLLCSLLIGLLIPLAKMPIPATKPDSGIIATYFFDPIINSMMSLEYSIEAIIITPVMANSSFSYQSLLSFFYWAGLILVLGKFLAGLLQISRLYYNGDPIKKKNYTLVKTAEYHLPFSFFNYLFWSTSFESDSNDEEKILLHEIAHIRGGHSFDVILLEGLKIILWCSPLIYLYKKELQSIHEYLADSEVLQSTEKKQYGRLLLRHARSGLRLALANHLIHSQIKNRINMITKNRSTRKALAKYLLALPVVLIMIFLFSNRPVLANFQEMNPQLINQASQLTTDTSIQEVFKVVEQMPRFPGCEAEADAEARKKCSMDKMIEYISQNLKYPQEAKVAGLEGMVVIRFVVDKKGKIKKAGIVREIGGGCGAEALRVVEGMPDWIPGKQKGKAVNVEFNLPMKFKLAPKDKKE